MHLHFFGAHKVSNFVDWGENLKMMLRENYSKGDQKHVKKKKKNGCQDKMGIWQLSHVWHAVNITLTHVWMELNNAGVHGEKLYSVKPAERLPVSSQISRCSNSYFM